MMPAAVLKTVMTEGYVLVSPASDQPVNRVGLKANRNSTPAARRLSSKALSVRKTNATADGELPVGRFPSHFPDPGFSIVCNSTSIHFSISSASDSIRGEAVRQAFQPDHAVSCGQNRQPAIRPASGRQPQSTCQRRSVRLKSLTCIKKEENLPWPVPILSAPRRA